MKEGEVEKNKKNLEWKRVQEERKQEKEDDSDGEKWAEKVEEVESGKGRLFFVG